MPSRQTYQPSGCAVHAEQDSVGLHMHPLDCDGNSGLVENTLLSGGVEMASRPPSVPRRTGAYHAMN